MASDNQAVGRQVKARVLFTKRRLLCALVLLLLVAVLLSPWVQYGIPGLWRGEHFWLGLPTSYWRKELRQWFQETGGVVSVPTPQDAFLEDCGLSSRRLGPLIAHSSLSPDAKARVLGDLMAEDDAQMRIRTGDWLVSLGHAAVPVLMDALQHKDSGVRAKAFQLLGRLGPTAALAVHEMADRLTAAEPDDADASRACTALSQVGGVAVPVLALRFNHPNVRVRQRVVETLANMNGADWDAAAILGHALDDEQESVRTAATTALASLARRLPSGGSWPQRDELVPVYTFALRDKNEMVRLRAIWALRWAGPAASRAVPELLSIVESKGPKSHDSGEAYVTLYHIGPPALPGILKMLEGKNVRNRETVVSILISILYPLRLATQSEALAQLTEESVSVLNRDLEDEDRSIRVKAAIGLGLVTKTPPNLPLVQATLLEGLKDADRGGRTGAARAFGALGARGLIPKEITVPALTLALKDREWGVREAATYALREIDPAAAPAQVP